MAPDGTTNAPVANAMITTAPATSSITTDTKGKFSLVNIVIGQYAVSVRKTDYTTESVNVTVALNEAKSVTVVLNKATGSNHRPNLPANPTPTNGAKGLLTTLTLSWHVSDPDGKSDTLRSDAVLYESNSTDRRQVLAASRDSSVTVTDLKYNTTYFWQVTVRDKAGETVRGDVWNFQTVPLPDNRFLYVRTVNGNTDIYSSDNTGGNAQRLTTSAFVETAPQLSPTRDRVAHTSNATGQFHLYNMNRDGSDQRRISVLALDGYGNMGLAYRWSPDGARQLPHRADCRVKYQ